MSREHEDAPYIGKAIRGRACTEPVRSGFDVPDQDRSRLRPVTSPPLPPLARLEAAEVQRALDFGELGNAQVAHEHCAAPSAVASPQPFTKAVVVCGEIKCVADGGKTMRE